MHWWKNLAIETQLQGIHTVKIVVAILIGFALMESVAGAHAIWMIITIIIIMLTDVNINVQMNKAVSRVLGTALGAGLGIGVVWIQFATPLLTLILVGVIVIFCYAKYTHRLSDYAASIGLATFSMIAINPDASLMFGVDRAFEIIVGIVISLLVSRYFFPVRSSRMLSLYIDKNWREIKNYAYQILIENKNRREHVEILESEHKILRGRETIEQVIRIKPFSKSNQIDPAFREITRYQMGVYRYITLIDLILHRELLSDAFDTAAHRDAIDRCNQAVIDVVENIASDNPSSFLMTLDQAVQGLVACLNRPAFSAEKTADQSLIFLYQRLHAVFSSVSGIVMGSPH